MGYTHYWDLGDFTEEDFVRFVSDCRTIVKASPVKLAGGDGKGEPSLKRGGIYFNGSEDRDEDFETFCITEHDEGFAFCKTACKPYDMIVVACLCALADRLGDSVKVTSNGNSEDWKDGVEFASKVLGRKVEIPDSIRRKENEV